MSRAEMLMLQLLISLSQKVDRLDDRVSAGQRREGRFYMKITELLEQAGARLTDIEETDQEILTELTAIQEGGGVLTDEQAEQAAAILARMDAIDASDEDLLAKLKAMHDGETTPPVEPPADNPTPVTDADGNTIG